MGGVAPAAVRVGQKPRFPRGANLAYRTSSRTSSTVSTQGTTTPWAPTSSSRSTAVREISLARARAVRACALGGGDLGRSGFDPGGGVLRVHDHIVQSGITQALHRQGLPMAEKVPRLWRPW